MVAELNRDLSNAQKERLLQLNGLDEFIMQALLHTEVVQLQRKVCMTITSKKRPSKKDIECFCMIQGLNISEAS